MEEQKKVVYVTTDNDYWNSADQAKFFVIKGQVKPLPEFTTSIVDEALEQGLIREATKQELDKYFEEIQIEDALRKGKIIAGNTFEETVNNYRAFVEKNNKKEVKQPIKEEKKVEEKQKIKVENDY